MSDRLSMIEERLKDLRDDLRTIDKAHLDRYHSLKTDTDAVKLLIRDGERVSAVLTELEERLNDLERDCGSAKSSTERLDRRVGALEAMNIAVLADRLDRLSKQVAWMIGAFITLILTTLGGIIVYLVSTQAP